jgi:transposase
VGMLIERETGVALSRSTISTYLRHWRLTPQRPRKRASERQEPDLCRLDEVSVSGACPAGQGRRRGDQLG